MDVSRSVSFRSSTSRLRRGGGREVLTHCAEYARPYCVQPAPVPAPGIVGGYQKGSRSLAHCQLRTLASQFCPNLRNNAFSFSNQHVGEIRRGSVACQVRRKWEFSLESHEMSTEDSSPGEHLGKTLRSKIWKPSPGAGESQEEVGQTRPVIGNAGWRTVSGHAFGVLLIGTLIFGVSSAEAADALKTCACLLKECRVELARCIANPGCAANVACLQTCNNRPDETECQIGCGDLFENQVVDQFNDCAVTRKGCVPQKQDEGKFPVPPPSALVQAFNPEDFNGKWYITSGLNRTFDTFDCQLHEFIGSSRKLSAKLAWRIPTPDGGFFTRSAMQNFVQDENQPAVLLNHGNEFLHYQDDWYILSAKTEKSPDDYIFIYYRGRNDAWDGYGGAVVYTRSSTLPPSIIPELSSSAKQVGLDFNKFTTTDNSCAPETPLFARLEKRVEQEEQFVAEEVEEEEMFLVQGLKQVVNSVGQFFADIAKGELDLFNKGAEEFKRDKERLLKELGDEEKALLDDFNMEAKDIERLFGKPLPIRRLR